MAGPGTGAQGPGPPDTGQLSPDPQRQKTDQDGTSKTDPSLKAAQHANEEEPNGQLTERPLGKKLETDSEKHSSSPLPGPTTEAVGPPPKVVLWSDKVKANPPSEARITEDAARKSHMLRGVWNPVQIKQLMTTIMTAWTKCSNDTWTEDEEKMRAEAEFPATARRDDAIRAWTQREHAIFIKYLSGDLDLQHPPNIIKEILVSEHRAMVEDMHDTYFNVTLTAIVPASVRLSVHTPHVTILKEIFNANTDDHTGHAMVRVFQQDVKRLSFDGNQTLHAVFYSKRASARWQNKTLRLKAAVITLRYTERLPEEKGVGVYTNAQMELQFAIRVYGGTSLGLATLTRVFASFSGAQILDAEYARTTRTEIYDNRNVTIRFAQRHCPTDLKGISRILLGTVELTIHHFQQHLRRPCTKCLNPWHGASRCRTKPENIEAVQSKSTRKFTEPVVQVPTATKIEVSVKILTISS
ncbi:hypothetical protein GN958_ATG07674 [Phytophthora infestans]|uniref:Uncharacterized protein n=1 Tax=Phytophthora infestans TaxID=4787 RepID=A0A8S9UVJ4_PHYIN|nr:hypothetical protein GN958_ATG07674 [Phytophthora infestans]